MGPAQAADSEPGSPAGGEKFREQDALHAVSVGSRFRRRVLHLAADAISRSLGLREREAPSSSDDGDDDDGSGGGEDGGSGGSPSRPAAAAQPPLLYSTALDFGCGAGGLSRLLAPRFEKIVGVDVCPARVDRFNESAWNQGIPASEMSARCLDVLAQPDVLPALGRFDCVYSCQVYHHLADPVAVTAALRCAVREGGALLAVDLCRSGPAEARPGRRRAARDGDAGADHMCPDCGEHHAGDEVHHRGGFDQDAFSSILSAAGLVNVTVETIIVRDNSGVEMPRRNAGRAADRSSAPSPRKLADRACRGPQKVLLLLAKGFVPPRK